MYYDVVMKHFAAGFDQVNVVMLSVAMFIMYRHAASAASSWKMKEKGRLENIR